MFENLDLLPPDSILGLIARFRDDPSPDKVDLGVGVYRDESGRTPIMAAVREAERLEAETGTSKAYFGQAGDPATNPVIQELVLGSDHPATQAGRAVTLQTPGGSGALRVAAELLLTANRRARVWVSDPTWPNHAPLIGAAGVDLVSYPYYDRRSGDVDRDAMFDALRQLGRGDVLLLHAACHNPTGSDLELDDWRAVTEIVLRAGASALVDSAYQGFSSGTAEDIAGARMLAAAGVETLIVTSFSKNFGLYRDRAGALTITGPSSRAVAAAHSNALRLVRTMYSTPPDHGPAVVRRVLTTPGLQARWESELDHMRVRLASLRRLLVDALAEEAGTRFGFIGQQRGMFSLLGIDERAATTLIDEYHIYLPANGRINVAGINPGNVERVAAAIAQVAAWEE